VRTADGKAFADARTLIRSGAFGRRDPDFDRRAPRPGENTTIGVVATNAVLTKVEATKMARMAHDGFARAISPVHTPADGDTIFALATGTMTGEANLSLIGALAAEVMADAIVRAATQATGVAGIPAVRDLSATK
jgi:L-aminopeptidase/D-esterase-like protein